MIDWLLRIHEPGKAPTEVALKAGLRLGRDRDNDCVIDDPSVSAHHAEIVAAGSGLAIKDLGSANKTRASDKPPLSKDQVCTLEPGLVLHLGKTRIDVIGPPPRRGTNALPTIPSDAAPPKPASVPLPATHAAIKPAAASPVVEQKFAAEQPKSNAPMSVPAMSLDDALTASSASTDPTLAGDDPAVQAVARRENLKNVRARIVVASKTMEQFVDVNKDDFIIGRSRRVRDAVDLVLNHKAVSSQHARITLSGFSFFIEDLDSQNKTWLGSTQLPPKTKYALRSDIALRFGPVECLFVTDLDSDGRAHDPKLYARSVQRLVDKAKITALQQLQAAAQAKDQNRHPGEILIHSGIVSVAAWVEALEEARLQAIVAPAPTNTRLRRVRIMVFVLLAAAIAFMLFKMAKQS
jgi:pSer/pThr/pTyr-binding forkhead associated (FHA) protein